MDINVDKIQKALSFDPTNESYRLTVTGLMRKADEGQLSKSYLGRWYDQEDSWNYPDDAKWFNARLFGKTPLPAIAININGDNSNKIEKLELYFNNDLNNSVWSVVDGKQRLEADYGAWCSDKACDEKVDYDYVVFNLIEGVFEAIDDVPSSGQVPVDFLLNKNQQRLTDYITKHFSVDETKEVTPLLFGIRNKLLNYTYTILTAHDLTLGEQQNWYNLLHNRRG